MQNRFLCTEIYLTYPDLSVRISDIVSQTRTPYYKISWETIKRFISDGNLIFIIRDLNARCGFDEEIVAVAFYSFSNALFDGLVCSEDVFIDKKYKYSFLDKYFWNEIKERIISRKVKKFFSKQLDTREELRKEGYSVGFFQVLEPPKKS